MAKIDCEAWVERARQFTAGLRELPGRVEIEEQFSPPLAPESVGEVAAKWPGGLPAVLRSLWTEGSSHLKCRWIWNPSEADLPRLHEVFESNNYIYGGPDFMPAAEIYPGNLNVDVNDPLLEDTLGKEGLALWARCAVFMWIANGDALGLDPLSDPDDPAVIYLLHDDEYSGRIAPSLGRFLSAWEQICYIGPEFWLLDEWLDWDRETIVVDRPITPKLRQLLTSPR